MAEIQAEQELAFIKKVMEDSRRIILDDGKGFIFWGVLVVIGQVLTFFSIYYKMYTIIMWIWVVLIGFGWLYTFITELRREQKRRVHTLAGKILAAVWISLGVSATTLGFLGPLTGAYHTVYINPLISILLAVAYFISGVIYREKWISALALAWWAGAIAMFIWPYIYTMLLMASMMIFFQIIPGIILYKRSKNELQDAG